MPERGDREQAGARSNARSAHALRHRAMVQGHRAADARRPPDAVRGSARTSAATSVEGGPACFRARRRYFRRPRFRTRQSGSRGTLTIAQGARQPSDDLERGRADRAGAPSPRSRGSARRRPRWDPAPRSAPTLNATSSRAALARRRASSITSSETSEPRARSAAPGEAQQKLPLAAADLVHVPRARADRQALELVAEPAHEPPFHRIGATRTCRRRCRRRSAATSPRSQPPTSLRSRPRSKLPRPSAEGAGAWPAAPAS